MPGRVNTKFVILLASVLVVLVGGMFAFYLAVVHQSAEQLATLGDRYRQEGDIVRAVQHYDKAAQKDQRNVELMLKLASALEDMPVRDRVQARNALGRMRQVLQRAAGLRPQDPQVLERYYCLEYEMAQQAD